MGALARFDPAVPARRVVVFLAVVALVGASPASARTGWTLPHARAVLSSQTIDGWDDAQPDDPYFAVTLDRTQVAGLRSAGTRFAYKGLAHDTVGGGTIPVAFTIEPQGAAGFRVLVLHGPPPDTSQPALPLRAAFTRCVMLLRGPDGIEIGLATRSGWRAPCRCVLNIGITI